MAVGFVFFSDRFHFQQLVLDLAVVFGFGDRFWFRCRFRHMHETGTERRRVGGTEGRRDGGRGESLKVLHSRQFGSSAPPDRHPETFKHHYNEAVPSRKGASTRPPHLHVNNPRTEPPPLPPPLRLADRSISTARSLLVVLHLKNALFLHRAQSGGRYSHHHLRIRGWGKRENVGWRQVCVGRRIPGTIRGGN